MILLVTRSQPAHARSDVKMTAAWKATVNFPTSRNGVMEHFKPIYTSPTWQPMKIEYAGDPIATSTGVTRVFTDAGWAYCKPIGNRQGEQVLACEWVCVRLAKWFGLPTFDAAVIDLPKDKCIDLAVYREKRYRAKAGPCFLTRDTPGHVWGRKESELDRLSNPGDLTKLVAFDCWVLNRDRYLPDAEKPKANYGNVFLADLAGVKGNRLLTAMDHTHCFDNGQLNTRLSQIDLVKEGRVFGMFPAFRSRIQPVELVAAVAKLKTVSAEEIATIIAEVPDRWGVDAAIRKAWCEQIVNRARFLAEELPGMIAREV
jgi:hypothetical protein